MSPHQESISRTDLRSLFEGPIADEHNVPSSGIHASVLDFDARTGNLRPSPALRIWEAGTPPVCPPQTLGCPVPAPRIWEAGTGQSCPPHTTGCSRGSGCGS